MSKGIHVNRFIDLHEVTKITCLKKTKIYELIKLGEFKPVKLGRKTVFSIVEIVDWINCKLASRNISAGVAK